jgi:polyvinyl alcohol dehydrogenase (cytochrome)
MTIEGEEKNWLFFGDAESHTSAVDARTGKLVWRTDVAVSEHSIQTGAVIFHDQKLYVPVSLYEVVLAADPNHECCKAHGALSRLDAASGEIEWTTHMTIDAVKQRINSNGIQQWGPSGVPIWSTPTIDSKRRLLYVGTGQNASYPATRFSDSVVAMNLTDGEIKWHYQATAGDTYNGACSSFPQGASCPKWVGPDFDFGASIILTRNSAGRDVLVAGQKSGDIYALDPDAAGAVIWRTRIGKGSLLGGVHWGMAVRDYKVYAASNDSPFPGSRREPGLYTLDIDTGDVIW